MKTNFTPQHLWKISRLSIACLFLLLFIMPGRLPAQGYVKTSQVYGVAGQQTLKEMVVDNTGNTYLLITGGFSPITITSPATGTNVLLKQDPDGNVIWSRRLPQGSGTSTYNNMMLYNGVAYLLGSTTGTGMEVTNGSAAKAGTDIVFSRVDATSGAILTAAYLGGSGEESTGLGLVVENGNAFVTYTTTSTDIPVTTGPAFTTGYDHVIQKLDASGNPLYSTYTGSVATAATNTDQVSLVTENGNAYLGLVVSSVNDFAVDNGRTVEGSYDFGVVKLDASGNKALGLVYGGTGDEIKPVIVVNNGEIYLSGHSNSGNYPVTDGTSVTGSSLIQVLTKFSGAGQVVYSSNQAGLGPGADLPRMQWKDGALYLLGSNHGGATVVNVTDGSSGGSYLIKLNPSTGQSVFATEFGGNRNFANTSGSNFVIENDKIYTITPGLNASAQLAITDGSTRLANGGTYTAVFNTAGKLLFGSYRTTGNVSNAMSNLAVSNGNLYVAGSIPTAYLYPLTKSVMGTTSSADVIWMAFTFCPPMPADNDISPLSQSICANGFTQPLAGNKVAFTSDNMPMLYRNGTPIPQLEISARYQWQVADAAGGPWTSISGTGTQKDYSPPTGVQSRYYRRLVLPPTGCGDDPVSTSAVAAVLIGSNVSPAITSQIFNTCAGSPVNINAAVTGGASPYGYAWDNGIISTTDAATVTPASNSIYTVTVTDANSCQQVGQVIVNAYAADAGAASVGSCAGKPIRIGTAPPAGLAGVTYSWTPVAGLDDPAVAQPLASPTVTTIYTLSMTVPVSGGGTCTTTDDVTVNVVAAPVVANFAGDDIALCKGGSAPVGITAEAGFTYTWAPGNYLNSTTTSQVMFNAGSEQPQPNSFTYNLTAVKDGCAFTDAVTVSVLEVDAGKDLCGPRTVGTGDKMPGVTGKIYLWEKISGPGTITGATNAANTTVSESIGGSTIYRLTASYLGVSCTDEVIVPECSGGGGGCPSADIKVIADHGCPSVSLGSVALRALPTGLPASEWTYSWSSLPAGGISSASGGEITLTDNTERDVTLTITSVVNPSISCSKTLHVNAPSWSLPVFTVQDHTICPATTVSLGQTAIAGYSYAWKAVEAGDENISNPSVTASETTNYPVTITEDLSGCLIRDTAIVTVKSVIANPGVDWTACSSAMIELGSPALAGYTYSWSPQVASYQQGTTYQSAQPKVLVATTQDFTLTATDTETGCSKDSTVHIVIDDDVTLPAIADKTICKGGSAVIGNPGMPGVTYSWSPATGLSSTTDAQPTANPTATQIYTVTATYYDAGGAPSCTKSGTVTVTVNAPEFTMSDDAICPSGALYDLSTGVTPPATAISYSWQPAVLVTSPSAFSTTVKANPNQATTFTLTATDGNGCMVSASKTVSPTIATPVAGSNSIACAGSPVQLGDASNTGTIAWTVSPAPTNPLSDATAPAPIFTPAPADAGITFTFTISSTIAGCVNTNSVNILVKSLSLPVMAPQTVCTNSSTTIGVAATPNISYEWTPATGLSDPYAATTSVTNITGTRVYTLMATDANGCTATSQAVVGVNPTSSPTITIPDVTVAVGTEGMPFVPQIAPQPATYTYSWTPAAKLDDPYIAEATAVPGGIGTTTYDLSITDENGCTSSAPARLHVVSMITLPVTLSSFAITSRDCYSQLSWKIETAENFSHFVIERSGEGSRFEEIGRVYYAAGRSNYHFDDPNPGNGNWYYRLKMTDLDGKVTYSVVVLAKVNCATRTSLVVYPNPVNSQQVYIKSSKPVKSVVLLSLTGNVILRQDYRQTQAAVIELPLKTHITPGIYMVQIWATDGSVQYGKIMIARL